jgi:hypothetical protein
MFRSTYSQEEMVASCYHRTPRTVKDYYRTLAPSSKRYAYRNPDFSDKENVEIMHGSASSVLESTRQQ